MSYFTTQRPVKRVTLPTAPDLWVEVFTKFSWKQEKEVGAAIAAGRTQLDAVLNNVIATWNLTDESGEVAPIDSEHVDMLERADAIAIIDAVNGMKAEDDTAAKKASSHESPAR